MALVWSQRTGAYWFGVLCLVLSALAYAACHVAPFWQLQNNDPDFNVSSLHIGLWYSCADYGTCFSHDFSSDEVYLHVTRGLQLGGLVALVVCVVMTCGASCRRQHPGHKVDVALSAFILFTALESVSGALVYLAFTVKDVHDLPHLRYDWAFAGSLGSSGLALLSAAILLSSACCKRSPCAASPAQDKTETAFDWNDDEDNYAEPAQMLHGEDFGESGPYTVTNYHEAYFVDDVHHDNLSCCSGDLRPLPRLPPPGEPGVHSALSAENLYTAFPLVPTAAARGEVLSKLYDTRENAGTTRHVENVDDDHLTSSWSWHEGLEMDPSQSPAWRRRAEERWYYGGNNGTRSSSSVRQPEGVEALRLAEPRPVVGGLSPFMFPRVVVRGYYEPGQGYPEYVMM